MNELIKHIKRKKELSDVSNIIVKSVLEDYLKFNNLKIPKSHKEIKIIVKDIRRELREYTGRFQVKFSAKKRLELLNQNNISELLKSHSSTRERLESGSYNILISYLTKLSPTSILDLACGINPLVISKEFPQAKYYATDIKEGELALLEDFFRKNKIDGKTFIADIRKNRKYPQSDVCLMLKILDIIEKKGHKKAHELLNSLKCKHLVISFSTRTLSGKLMKFSERKWIEEILGKLNYQFEIERSSNEIFYFCKKLTSKGICPSSY